MTKIIFQDARSDTLLLPNLGRGLYSALKDLNQLEYSITNQLLDGANLAELAPSIAAISNSLLLYEDEIQTQLDSASARLK
jgi:hypothetical protein